MDAADCIRTVRIYEDGTDLAFQAMGRSEDGSGKVLINLLDHPDENVVGTASTSGDDVGRMGVLAWAGDGTSTLLACVQRRGKKGRTIVFLEPNGLQHGACKLVQRMEGEEVVGLDWNADSDVVHFVDSSVDLARILQGDSPVFLRMGYVSFGKPTRCLVRGRLPNLFLDRCRCKCLLLLVVIYSFIHSFYNLSRHVIRKSIPAKITDHSCLFAACFFLFLFLA